ncbi:MAG TPA: sugar-transfer associated ATP-grasp domain-containing protein [Rhodocyclaceae bacterium]|nr:sugar-transfer associated ATP-grasp domain-containing protein [Rhodocyclaceae bacterium]
MLQLARRGLAAASRHAEIKTLAALNCRNTPEDLRKPFARRYLDLLYSMIRWNELTPLYYAQQLDHKGKHISRDFLTYRQFQRMRNRANGTAPGAGPFNYACLLQDKLLFERYFAARGIPVARSIGATEHGGLLRDDGTLDRDFWRRAKDDLEGMELFVKPRYGIKGRGAFKLRFTDGQIILNDTPTNPEELDERLSGSAHIVQKVIEQHPSIAQLHPPSLNTLRIIMFRSADEIHVFLPYLRMACGGRITDNNAVSRALVQVDEHSGRAHANGYLIREGVASTISKHPDSGIVFSELAIPYLGESIELAKSAHRWMPDMYSIGWDVAITPNGPLLLEGNDDWGATTPMWVMPDFVPRFLEMTGRAEVNRGKR